jgi:rifampicin phosphotransferase
MRKCGCVGAEFAAWPAKIVSIAFAAIVIGTTPAAAIPSPELVVGSFVSLSQLFAIGSAMLGGGAAYATMRMRHGGGRPSRSLLVATLGLIVLFAASLGANIYQYISHGNERQERLESTLLRPSQEFAGQAAGAGDLDFRQQGRHPQRISTLEAARLLSAHNRRETDKFVFLDVREPAEQTMGTLKGVTAVRFPDLQKANLSLTGKTVILFCDDGSRSARAAEAMAKIGIDAKFVVGGLEKWIVENRDTTGMTVGDLAALRTVPNYAGRTTLLDTPQVKAAIENEQTILVDVRHPAAFANGHIPGAVNLDLLRLSSEAVGERIAKLPKRPIVLPCYDRRGCIVAEVLGFELTRADHAVLGRYTLPWEYYVSDGRPPYVQTWMAGRDTNLWTKAAQYLSGVLQSVANWTGVLAAIALLALLSRLLVLPFSLKAERDQIRSRAGEAELETLKKRLKDDPMRRTRAIRAFYRRYGITPGRNLLALLFLPVMAIALLAVQELSAKMPGEFLWTPGLAERDPWLILPVVFGVLITLYVDRADGHLGGLAAVDDRDRRAVRRRRRHLPDRQCGAAHRAAALGRRQP